MIEHSVAFAPTELFVVLLSSYFRSRNDGFVIIIPDDIYVSFPVNEYVRTVGGRIVSAGEASKLDREDAPSHLWVHSFGKAHISKGLIENFGADYSLYSDGIKNEIGKSKVDQVFPDYKSVLFFGFIVKKPFIKSEVHVEVCTFKDIVSAFDALKTIVGVELSFDADDLKKDWVFLRYWGQGPGEFVGELGYSSVIKKYLSTEGVSDLVLKGDSRVKSASTDDVLKSLRDEYSVVALEDRVEFYNVDSLDADKFFAEVMLPEGFSGRLHCFNSSLSVYAAVKTDADIRFPREGLVKRVFANSRFANNVVNYTALYQSVCNKIKRLKDEDLFKDDHPLVVEKKGGEFFVREAYLSKDDENTIENF